MILSLIRKWKSPTALMGWLSVNGVGECYILENALLAIPVGSYKVTLYNSPHAGHVVPLLNGLPNRTFVEIHCGDFACDSKGCLLTGAEMGPDRVMMSIPAFNHLFPQIQAAINAGEAVLIDITTIL